MTYKEWFENHYRPVTPIIDPQKLADWKAQKAREDWLRGK